MARYLALWHSNPVAPWPTDPAEYSKLNEKMWAAIDGLLKKGEIKEFGFFADGSGGYVFGEGEGADIFRNVHMFSPFIESEVHEVISYEKGKEILRAVLKAQAAAKK